MFSTFIYIIVAWFAVGFVTAWLFGYSPNGISGDYRGVSNEAIKAIIASPSKAQTIKFKRCSSAFVKGRLG